jgi:glyoxylase-like metal-dependent hydrolase (beta-lactamase superfamily II)
VELKISAVLGNSQWLDGGAMFGNVPRTMWERWEKSDQLGRIKLNCRALLLEAGDKRVLFETGIGAFFEPKLQKRYGVEESDHRLLANLAALGVEPSDIDLVVLSHLHFDHAGGLLPSYAEIEKGHTDLLFENAKYVVGKRAWERALNPHPRDRASFVTPIIEGLQNSGRLLIIDDAKPDTLMDGLISFSFTDGHTPGQMHSMIHGKKRKVFFAGDLVPGASWVHVPVTMGYDRYAEKVIDEKKQAYQYLDNPEWWLFFTHDAKYSAAQITRDDRGRYQACNMEETWERLSI